MHPGLGKTRFDAKSPQTLLQSTRDNVAGRTSDVDPLLDWVEKKVDPITSRSLIERDDVPVVDVAGALTEVGRSRPQARMMLIVLMVPMVLANDAHGCVFLSGYRVGTNLSIVRLSRNLTI